jgi:hypothetical protein
VKVKIGMTFKTVKIYYYLSFLNVSAIMFGILSYLYKLFSVLCLEVCEQDSSLSSYRHIPLRKCHGFLIMFTFFIIRECVYFEGRKRYWIKVWLLVMF